MTGRPSSFTQEAADEICVRLMEGQSLREICSNADMPGQRTVYDWLATNEAFAKQYARAREVQADTYADETKDIADDGRNDWMERKSKEGAVEGWQINGEAVARSRLRLDQRKWHASKLAPKKYGDRQQVEHSGSVSIAALIEGSFEKPEDE
jgi:hypothetical protein